MLQSKIKYKQNHSRADEVVITIRVQLVGDEMKLNVLTL